jgi:hypothetical protein
MPTPQHIKQLKRWRSKLKETAYGTSPAVGTPANYVQDLGTRSLATLQPNVADNNEYATGYPRPTDQWLVAHDVNMSHDFQLCSEEIGRDLYDALGKVTTSQPDAPTSGAVYSHVFATQDLSVSRQLPSRTWIEQLGSAIDRLFPGVCMAQLAMSGEGTQRLMGSRQLVGSGKETSPSGLTGNDITGLHYFEQSQATLKFDTGAVLTNMATAPNRLNSWRFEIINQLLSDDGFIPGSAAFQSAGDATSGQVRTENLLGDQSFNFVCNVRMLSNDPLRAYLKAQTNLIITIDIEAGLIAGTNAGLYKHRLSIKAYKAPFRAVEIGERNGLVSLQITMNPLYDLSSGKDVEITLVNGTASYTT